MAVKGTQLNRPIGRHTAYSDGEPTEGSSFVSYWLTGFVVFMVLAMTMAIVNATAHYPTNGVGLDQPMVLPEASSAPGSGLRDGRAEALDNIAGVPSGSSSPVSIDQRLPNPDTDRLPGRDDRRPQPVPAPI